MATVRDLLQQLEVRPNARLMDGRRRERDVVIDRVEVRGVDAAEVREILRAQPRVDFNAGGHHYVYEWIPEGEVWIDRAAAAPLDQVATYVHEVVERAVQKILGWRYDPAHEVAMAVEKHLRDLLPAGEAAFQAVADKE